MKKLLYLIFALFVCSWSHVAAQELQTYSFLHINNENGLSQSNVKAILQDSYGFMWFGTKNGLNRYDGKSVVQFNCNDYTKNRSNHNISSIFEEDPQTFWIGTDEGVYRYNPITDEFTFLDLKTDNGEMITTWVAKFAKDKNGDIWIVIPSQGIFRYDHNKLHVYHVKPTPNPHNLCVCDNGDIYCVAWYTGFFKFDQQKDTFRQITTDANGQPLVGIETNTLYQQGDYLIMAIQNGEVKKYNFKKNILEDITLQNFKHTFVRDAAAYGDEIWVCTYDGLYVLNEKQNSVKHFTQNLLQPGTLSDNITYTVYRDKEGGTWIGTMFGGVNYLANRTIHFNKYLPGYQENTLSSKRIREITEDSKGNIWIGTEDEGINILSLKNQQITRLQTPQSKYNTHVTLVMSSFYGKTYCSLYKDGLLIVDENGKTSFYDYKDLNISQNGYSIYALYVDAQETLWVGTDYGVYYAPKGTMNFTAIPELDGNWTFDIMEDKDGILWFATMGKGAWRYDRTKKTVKHYTCKDGEDKQLSSNSVSSIMQDSKGNIWLSTDRGGICRYNSKEDNFTRFSIEEGMPDDVAYKILEDNKGYLWFGTNRGLVRFQPETNEIRVFTVKDGLCGNQFNYKSAVKGKNGMFYFGSIEGLISFNPNFEEQPSATLPIYITGLSIFNKEVTAHTPNSPLKQSIICTNKIVLPYNQANISLDVALLSYSTSQTNEYFYKLLPIDREWISSGTENNISYANLPPGKYVLNIRATTGEQNTDYATRSLTIIILPPWYASIWAYLLYFILCIAIFISWFYWYRRNKNKQFFEKQKLFEIEKQKELNENKVEFFTEIAHEIRTPLTLINGPLEIIREMDIKDNKLVKNLLVIEQNTKRLLNLASQLLDFQKLGANKLTLNYETVNISDLLKETVARFEPTYTHQQKELKIIRLEEDIYAKIDKEAITKILSNLLNNALKYGKEHISVELRKNGNNFEVVVTSDGDKIPETKAEQIFEAFHQENKEKKEKQGVGIGLALSRSLALLHKGTLVLDTTHPHNAFVLTVPINIEKNTTESKFFEAVNSPLNETISSEEKSKGKIILIVEDEESILAFMKERLQEYFIIESATNGKIALDILQKEHIDLVISDVMMPVMNGIELCTAIKSDIDLCHIPIIFLTAKNDLDSKISGLKAGAEAYIEKPFSFDYLKAQIFSLLNNRQKEREAFSKRPFFPVQNMQMSKEDEDFMARVIQVINDNLEDETFNVERMAEALCLSRSSLLRKIKTLFNLSPIDFIRLIRLKKAAELIQDGKYRVGEICYMVGFNSHSYFSKLFCKQFGMTPKDFEKQISGLRDKARNSQEINIEDLIQRNKTNS